MRLFVFSLILKVTYSLQVYNMLIRGSMDHSAKIWDIETGKEIMNLKVFIKFKGSSRRNCKSEFFSRRRLNYNWIF
jgi:hypothetical protein